MLLEPIITSLLETDMYKFSMGQCIYHQFSDYKTTWSFKCRNTDVHFTHEMVEEIKEQIKAYCGLRFTEEELEYLHKIKWMKGSYVDRGSIKIGTSVFHYWVKHYGEPSIYGYEEGRASKIMLKRNGEIVFNFDRGLDVPPADRDTETALAILLKEYN